MNVWRLHLRPKDMNPSNVVSYCLENKFIGLGWEGPDEIPMETIEDYLKRHREKWGYRERSVHTILERVRPGDLIWARDADGGYLLAQATSPSHPRFGNWADLRDMYHVIPSNIIGGRMGAQAIQDTEVPGSIKASFSRRGATIHRLHDKYIENYSTWLFANKTGGHEPEMEPAPFLDLLDPYELEDLVALYLQELGWKIVLSSHASNTPRYEATLVHPKLGTAGFQVKHKGASLPAERFANDPQVDWVFLFAASGDYGRERPANVKIIDKEGLLDFSDRRQDILPSTISHWLNLSKGLANA